MGKESKDEEKKAKSSWAEDFHGQQYQNDVLAFYQTPYVQFTVAAVILFNFFAIIVCASPLSSARSSSSSMK